MKNKQFLFGLAFAVGLFLVAGYSIDNRGFHSGISGLIGCGLLLVAYLGFFGSKIKSGDQHARRLAWLLASLLALVLVLDIVEALLARS